MSFRVLYVCACGFEEVAFVERIDERVIVAHACLLKKRAVA